MCDEKVGDSELVLQILEQVDHLSLNRYIEGGHRFITDNKFWSQGYGSSNPDSLALTTGELIGITVEVFGVESHAFHGFANRVLHPSDGFDSLDFVWRANNAANRVPWVQR